MRRQRKEIHGEDFDLRADVSLPGRPLSEAPLTYQMGTVSSSPAYHCVDCPGKKFLVGEVEKATLERRRYLRANDPVAAAQAIITEMEKAQAGAAAKAQNP